MECRFDLVGGSDARAGEPESVDPAQGEVEQGVGFWLGGVAGDEEERRLGGEVGRRQREEGAVGAAGCAEGEEILEVCEAPRNLRDQLRQEVRRGGAGSRALGRGDGGWGRAHPPAANGRRHAWRLELAT